MEETILGILFEHYNANSTYDFKPDFEHLHNLLQDLSFQKQEDILSAVITLCAGYEKQGFTAGIKVGFRLAGELK